MTLLFKIDNVELVAEYDKSRKEDVYTFTTASEAELVMRKTKTNKYCTLGFDNWCATTTDIQQLIEILKGVKTILEDKTYE